MLTVRTHPAQMPWGGLWGGASLISDDSWGSTFQVRSICDLELIQAPFWSWVMG